MKLLSTPILILVLTAALSNGNAQEVFSSGGRLQAMADASCGLSGSWSALGNQAGLAVVSRPELAGSFQNRFLVSELSSRTGLLVVPVQGNVFALSYMQFGKIPFLQEKIGLAYARSIGPRLRFGLQFNRYGIYLAEENRSATNYGQETGLQYIPNERFTLGLHVVNPYQTKIRLASQTYRYVSNIRLGGFYRFSHEFGWAMEVGNAFDNRVLIKSGFEYKILQRLLVRAGVAGKPYQFSAGFGFRLRKLNFDFASSYNQNLGNSPSVSFQYQF